MEEREVYQDHEDQEGEIGVSGSLITELKYKEESWL